MYLSHIQNRYHKGLWKAGIETGQGTKKYAGSNDLWEGDWRGSKSLDGKAVTNKNKAVKKRGKN